MIPVKHHNPLVTGYQPLKQEAPMSSENVTIYDIASAAGVSIATVSRVLREDPVVSRATREKVEKVIAQYHYRPSSIARGLTSKVTHTLGIILPKLLNPNYAMIFTGAQEEARQSGCTVNLFSWSSLGLDLSDPPPALADRRLDGIIVCVEYLPPDQEEKLQLVLSRLRRFMPVVLIGCIPPDLEYPGISYNMAELMRRIVGYLVSLGHERIAFIGGVREDTDPLRRDVGYQEGLREAGLPRVDSWRVYGKATPEVGRAALEEMFSSLKPDFRPTAVIGLNDLVAMGCMAAARSLGLRLPEDLSVIGCDDLFCAPYLSPALTSVNTHQQEMGSRAVRMILSGDYAREQASWDLVLRSSCAPAQGGRQGNGSSVRKSR